MPTQEMIEQKFRSIGLQETDREPLAQLIAREDDPNVLTSLLYIFGYSFAEDERVLNKCVHFIRNPQPGLTAHCLRVACDYWGHRDEFEAEIAAYLDPRIFDVWYDEVIFVFSFVTRNPYGWSRETLARYGTVEREANRLGLSNFK